ncbi:hypothetical protein PPACK8108_LOCUS743 [Phakopsora pachyrhizi]|uniref:Uncharacterized protein n=1 Tax=Phakopsora pachyrhizi TaxID=170000 RepID=A0AAV0AGV7_PHAPC|nr:hypothetical protein PPACK8108_LOCUS743 [Phakopsora pachyrhizi]
MDNSGIIPDSHSIRINNPEIQVPQSLFEAQIPSQGDTLSIPETTTSSSTLLNTGKFSDLAINTNGPDMFLAKSNELFFSEEILNTTILLDSNTPIGHLPKNIHNIVYIMRPISNPPVSQQMIWANFLFESLHLVARDIIAPVKFRPHKVTADNTLSVECALAGFLASSFSFNKNKSAVLPIEGLKGNEEPIKDHAAGTFKNLDDFVDKIVHVLIDIPSTPSPATCPKGKGKASSSSIDTVSTKTLQLVYKEICLEWPLYCLLMAFCAAGVRGLMLGSNNWRECGALESL